jgi:hypothetical protein
LVRDLIKGDREVGSQYFLNISLRALDFVQEITECDEKLQRTIMFLTKDYMQPKPVADDFQPPDAGLDGPGRYSDISSKTPSIKAPRKHLDSVKVTMGAGT